MAVRDCSSVRRRTTTHAPNHWRWPRISFSSEAVESWSNRPPARARSERRRFLLPFHAAPAHPDGMTPSYDEATLAAYFHPPAAELFRDPIVGAELRRLAVEDPDIIAAVAEVDRSQIRDCLHGTPGERLRAAENDWNDLAKLRHVG